MRYVVRILPGVLVAGALALAVSFLSVGPGAYAASTRCTGGGVIQSAPYSCTAKRVIDGTAFTVMITIDTRGTAVVTFAMAAPRSTDTPIVVRSYTGVSGQPVSSVSGVIRAGETTARLVLAPVRCGQLDVKAVWTKPGAAAGRIAGPSVTWGTNCKRPPTTVVAQTTVPATAPTTTPTTFPPTTTQVTTTAPPEATSIVAPPTTAATTLPVTGGTLGWLWATASIAVGGVLILVSRVGSRRPKLG